MRESEAYERFIESVMNELIEVEVHRQRPFVGKRSGRTIKVDLSFTQKVVGSAEVLVIVECKRYRSRVKVGDVEEFQSKLEDIGAHKGIVITTVGFQAGAILAAKGWNIALALLTDKPQAGEIEWILNCAGPANEMPRSSHTTKNFLRGNIRGLLGDYDGGLRFRDGGELFGMLAVEFMGEAAPNPGQADG